MLLTGPGTLGLTVLQIAKAAEARVIVSGTAKDGKRLQMAKKTCNDFIIYTNMEDIGKRVDELTSGKGEDVVIECAGNDVPSAAVSMPCASRASSSNRACQAGESNSFSTQLPTSSSRLLYRFPLVILHGTAL